MGFFFKKTSRVDLSLAIIPLLSGKRTYWDNPAQGFKSMVNWLQNGQLRFGINAWHWARQGGVDLDRLYKAKHFGIMNVGQANEWSQWVHPCISISDVRIMTWLEADGNLGRSSSFLHLTVEHKYNLACHLSSKQDIWGEREQGYSLTC